MNNRSATISEKIKLGLQHHLAGRLQEAEKLYREVLDKNPDNANTNHLLGVLIGQLGNHELSVQLISHAIELNPNDTHYFISLGRAYQLQGKFDDALITYDNALNIAPESAAIHSDRGVALKKLGRHEEALAAYNEALRLEPDNALAYNNRGNALQELGRMEEALAALNKALTLKPDYADAYNNKGMVLKELGDHEAALDAYAAALKYKPDYPEAYNNRGFIFHELTRYKEALSSFRDALHIDPDYAEARWAYTMVQLPAYYESVNEISQYRAAYEKALDELIAWCDANVDKQIARMWSAVGVSQPFFLAYQGYNDRDLHARYGLLACKVMQEWYRREFPSIEPNRKIKADHPRIGIITDRIRRHSVWDVFIKGFITHLDRSRFTLYCYHTGWRQDEQTEYARNHVDRFVQGPLSLQQWLKILQDDQPDILIYPEVGTDTITSKLSALRLAPIQMTTWGYPDTSGLPTMDYYLSGELLEPADARDHYTETLVKLPNFGCCFEPLGIEPAPVNLSELGIPDDPDIIRFVSCQTAFKYLPQYDEVFIRIAKNVRQCRFLFFEIGKTEAIIAKFKQRLDRTFRETGLDMKAYCIFLTALPREQFLGLLGQMDVYLDTISFSGFTTAIQALACNGLPIVTVEGDLMRKRLSSAILRRIGVTQTIAADVDEYVNIAVRLAQDKEFSNSVRKQIIECLPQAYSDQSVIRALENFLDQAIKNIEETNTCNQADYYNNLGHILRKQGKLKEALDHYQEATRHNPDFFEGHNNTGNIYLELGMLTEALTAYQEALRINPHYADTHNNRGVAYKEQGQMDEALAAFAEAIRLNPDYAGAYNNRGNVLRTMGKHSAALDAFGEALRIDPEFAEVYNNRGVTLRELGRTEEALADYTQALRIKPDYGETRWSYTMAQIPNYYDKADDIPKYRAAYAQALDELISWCNNHTGQVSAQMWRAVGVTQPFFLAYQGYNDRDLHACYGQLACKVMQEWYQRQDYSHTVTHSTQSDKRKRIGFVSERFRRHSAWDVFIKGFITHLDRSRFTLYCYHTGWRQDEQTEYARNHVDRFVQGPLPPQQWLKILQEDQPDVLIYPEIGTDPVTSKLSALRLAPIQMTTWGYPDTSGLPTMDYYLSGELLEPADAREHYTETLVKLPNFGCCFEPLGIEPSPVNLAELGIPDDPDTIRFVSCQQAFKYLPQYDEVFIRIAQNVRQCRFIFFQHDNTKEIFNRFTQRLDRAFRQAGLNMAEYCILLNKLPRRQFLGLLQQMDVYLDTIAFSGFTTAIQALACNGLPIVTLEGDLMRKRLSSAILRRIGVTQTIAADVDEYVNIAVRLAQDTKFRNSVRTQISEHLPRAYSDLSVIRAFEDLINDAVNSEENTHQLIT